MTAEKWKPIKGFEKRYLVSSKGRVKSLLTGNIRKANQDKKGYFRVDLKQNGYRKNVRLHRLTGTHFLRPTKKYPFINHMNGDKTKSDVRYLEVVNNRENVIHGNQVRAHMRKTKKGKMISVRGHKRKH